MTRANFSPGQFRDLSKPLIEVEPTAPKRTQLAQRLANSALMTFPVIAVVLNTLLLLGFLVFLFLGG